MAESIIKGGRTTGSPVAGVTTIESGHQFTVGFIISVTGSGWKEVCSVPQPAGFTYYFFPVYNDTDSSVANARIFEGKLSIDTKAGTKNYRGSTTYIF